MVVQYDTLDYSWRDDCHRPGAGNEKSKKGALEEGLVLQGLEEPREQEAEEVPGRLRAVLRDERRRRGRRHLPRDPSSSSSLLLRLLFRLFFRARGILPNEPSNVCPIERCSQRASGCRTKLIQVGPRLAMSLTMTCCFQLLQSSLLRSSVLILLLA